MREFANVDDHAIAPSGCLQQAAHAPPREFFRGLLSRRPRKSSARLSAAPAMRPRWRLPSTMARIPRSRRNCSTCSKDTKCAQLSSSSGEACAHFPRSRRRSRTAATRSAITHTHIRAHIYVAAEITSELDRCDEAIESATGRPQPLDAPALWLSRSAVECRDSAARMRRSCNVVREGMGLECEESGIGH